MPGFPDLERHRVELCLVPVALETRQRLLEQGNGSGMTALRPVPLVILESPYRSLVDPVLEFVARFETDHRKDRHRFCMIVLPVFVTRHRWENLLHNQSTIVLRQALRERGTRVVTTVGFTL
ncbi:MAG: hypothetical protein VKO65_01400 [Cyanobacteriota bacterium]|nr:hypothetical protein [Cyanobacteriota bacterium]